MYRHALAYRFVSSKLGLRAKDRSHVPIACTVSSMRLVVAKDRSQMGVSSKPPSGAKDRLHVSAVCPVSTLSLKNE